MTWDAVKSLFGGKMDARQLEGLNLIRDASAGLPLKHRAYILATAYHETGGRMQPVREAFGVSDDDTINRLERAWAKGQLTWVKKPYWRKDRDGKAWFGRGHIQITFKENYRKLGERLGVDLVEDPNRALHPEVSALIAVVGCSEGLFTGKKLADYQSYRDMRRVVNGTDRADLIAGYAEQFEAALRGRTDRVEDVRKQAQGAVGIKENPDAHNPRNPLADLLQAIADIIRAIFGGKS